MQNQSINAKEIMLNVIAAQPEDAPYEEIMRELAFERMIERGVADMRSQRVISHEEMRKRIKCLTAPTKSSPSFSFPLNPDVPPLPDATHIDD